ncbi:hypothetical protein PPYR_00459 [Photinus pyralis]|uniref:Dipeptidyl peptidase 3 n=1 Tax=Photinus pyralis TaxID=7054 RepID=A0A1Y1LDC8_PHOPY|nr:dipeptidyl peptidase 3 [Photinus pyralis]KAB0803489.1 hypothetical protein PPYR_00459 [Photinus pyralis]
MGTEPDRAQFLLPLDQPIVCLDVSTAFAQLSKSEKFYAHHLSKACWTGGFVTLLQTSPESGPVFVLLHKLFSAQDPSEIRASASAHGFTDAEITGLFVYAAGVFSNAGNYKGFGDTKIVPAIEPERLEEVLKLSPVWSDLQSIWNCFNLKERLYDLSQGRTCLGFPPDGCTTYFSANCTSEDNARVLSWLKKLNLELYNTRCFKKVLPGDSIEYEIRLASEDIGDVQCEVDGKYKYRLVKGDYAPLMKILSTNLENALPYANQKELSMLQSYIRSFRTGSINEHKDGSRFWIQNKSPAIETYIGFIETYRDPAGVRGEFEGFVAIVNRPMSEKFSRLVDNAEQFLAHLPWPKEFEKDTFLRPDFTSLDVLTYTGSGIPAGINIPNYDDIRQSEGFKNVALGNVIPANYQYSKTPFLSEDDINLLKEWRVRSFELQVGLHELLGHGSGKLFFKVTDGSTNFPDDLLNPLTSNPITSCYQQGDTFDACFGTISSAYEECRAEAVGLFLSLELSILEIFGYKDQEADDIRYVNWLALIWAGAGKALEMWEPGRGWLQAHSQARYVLTKVLMQADVVKVTQPSKDDLLITVDRSALLGPGRNAISHFLLQLQVYKSTGDIEAAKKLFGGLSEVEEPWLSWRSIILAHKQPRSILIQPNTEFVDDNINIKFYDPHVESVIASWIDRFPEPEPLYTALIELASADLPYFP